MDILLGILNVKNKINLIYRILFLSMSKIVYTNIET